MVGCNRHYRKSYIVKIKYFEGFLLSCSIILPELNVFNWKFIAISAHTWKLLVLVARAAIAKYYREAYTTKTRSLTVPEVASPRSRCQRKVASSEASPLGLWMASFPLCPPQGLSPGVESPCSNKGHQ